MEKKEPKVVVLLSTYNGEKYLKQQLDSILEQTYENTEILVRDDGSKDATLSILKEYEKQNNVRVIQGKNIGFVDSFMELLKQSPDAQYYAFADQDDVWEKDKIKRAVSILEREESKEDKEQYPIMYYSSYDFYDENMQFAYHPDTRGKTNFLNSLVECVNLGMATVINKQAKDKVLQKIPKENCLGHDWWSYMICTAFGKVIYDEKSMVKHRIHQTNTSKCGESRKEKYTRRFQTLFTDNHFKKLGRQIQEFGECFYNDLSKENKETMDLFLSDKNICIQIKKIFYPKRIMNILKEEIILRVGFLLWMI